MIKIENIEVFGFDGAIRGMRNPMASWDLSDSYEYENGFVMGHNDIDLANRLFKAGTEHRKYMRMLHIQMDITANQVFWAEFDTYKVGTSRNSCSKMHKIHAKAFSIDDFSHEGIDECGDDYVEIMEAVVDACELLRLKYNETHEKKYWRALIELLPEGYNLRATVDFSYETAVNIINQRRGHKMMEWSALVDTLSNLPLMHEFMEGSDELYIPVRLRNKE